jgi:hypothetical protein
MSRRNRTETIKVPLSLDPTTNVILEDLAHIGLFGKNKAEVASSILRDWIWSNEEKLERHGINFATKNKRGERKRPK